MYYKNLDLEDIVYVNDKGIEYVEKWKDVPGYEGIYQVSDLGRVKSLERIVYLKNNKNRNVKSKILSIVFDGRGYLKIVLYKNCNSITISVHSLVAICFLNHVPNKTYEKIVDHKNNIKTDNRVENLQLISYRENSSKDKHRYNNSSKKIGVSLNKRTNKFVATISINKKNVYLGYFVKESEAEMAYNIALKNIDKYINNNQFRLLIKKALN